MPRHFLSVDEAAAGFGVSPRTVRRWLQTQRLAGHKIGGTWGVWWSGPAVPVRSVRPKRERRPHLAVAPLRTRLRQVGALLIRVGNQVVGARRRRGGVFLTWRRPRSLQIIFAIGRQHPTHGWAPHPLGTELPFWFRERSQWRRVLPLLRWYEQLRGWCHPLLLHVPGVGGVVLQEIAWLEAALDVLQRHQQESLLVAGQEYGSGALLDAVEERALAAESGEAEETVRG